MGARHGSESEDLEIGQSITFDMPGAMFFDPYGINNAGQIVGTYCDAVTGHGFLHVDGSYATLDVPGAGSPETGLVLLTAARLGSPRRPR